MKINYGIKILLHMFIFVWCVQSCAASQKREKPVPPVFPKFPSIDLKKDESSNDLTSEQKKLLATRISRINNEKCMRFYEAREKYYQELREYLRTESKM